MHKQRLQRMLFPLLGLGLVLLLAACGSSPSTSTTPTAVAHSSPTTTNNHIPVVTQTTSSGNGSTPASGTVSMPTTSTACPVGGTGRAAITANLQLGNHQNVVYAYNVGTPDAPTSGFLKRHDITTGMDIVIANLSGTYIANPQVSADGQWILFVAVSSGQDKLQMIRMDGQGLQTLYCASPEGGAYILSALSNVQWSTDQHRVVFTHFSTNGGSNTIVYLLNTSNGNLTREVVGRGGATYAPLTWLDNARVYLSLQLPDGPADSLYLLNTSLGANQPTSNLTLVYHDTPPNGSEACWSADSSYDGSTAFISECNRVNSTVHPGPSAQEGPSNILAKPATGGTGHIVFGSMTYAITTVRAVTRNTILFVVDNEAYESSVSVDKSTNGLWKINTDGTGATHLTNAGNLNADTQFPWSNISRDGNLYSLQVVNGNSIALQFGPMAGGSPTTFTTTTSGSTANLLIAGWTTI